MPKSKEFVESSDSSDTEVKEPKKKKKKVDSSSASDSEDSEPKQKKKRAEKKQEKKSAKASRSQTDREGNVMYPLSRTRFAVATEFRGKKMVNIREYYEADGELKPGRKGIALSMEQWQALKDAIPDIDETIKDM